MVTLFADRRYQLERSFFFLLFSSCVFLYSTLLERKQKAWGTSAEGRGDMIDALRTLCEAEEEEEADGPNEYSSDAHSGRLNICDSFALG